MIINTDAYDLHPTPEGVALYYRQKQFTRPGIDPLCGWTWLDLHLHDLDGWTPTIEVDKPGSHYKFTVKDKEILKEVSRMIREK